MRIVQEFFNFEFIGIIVLILLQMAIKIYLEFKSMQTFDKYITIINYINILIIHKDSWWDFNFY